MVSGSASRSATSWTRFLRRTAALPVGASSNSLAGLVDSCSALMNDATTVVLPVPAPPTKTENASAGHTHPRGSFRKLAHAGTDTHLPRSAASEEWYAAKGNDARGA